MEKIQEYAAQAIPMIVLYLPKILLAMVVMWIGKRIARKLSGAIKNQIQKSNNDPTLSGFLGNLVYYGLYTLVVISAISILGVEATSFVAVLGAAGLAVGMALQGSLGNFAGGVLLMLFKPFKVGDLIEAQNFTGVVKDIGIFATTLASPENKKIVIPNGPLAGGPMVNYTENGVIRVDAAVGIGYGEDISKARTALMAVLNANSKILQDPAPGIFVGELADSSVNLIVRGFCDPAHYWDVFFYLNEESKIALDKEGIDIPFPQTVMHQAA